LGSRRSVSANGAIYTSWGIAPGKQIVIPARTESPYYSGLFPFFHSPGLQPLEKWGHLSWGDAALAPGWYKSAPLALNCGF
jgi:hypothetical protein